MTQGHRGFRLTTFGLRMVEPIYKELAIETEHKMEKVLHSVAFCRQVVSVNDCICCT